MTFPYFYREVNLENGERYFLVYDIEDRYKGHVQLTRGGWIFYDHNGSLSSTATIRDDAVMLGVVDE